MSEINSKEGAIFQIGRDRIGVPEGVEDKNKTSPENKSRPQPAQPSESARQFVKEQTPPVQQVIEGAFKRMEEIVNDWKKAPPGGEKYHLGEEAQSSDLYALANLANAIKSHSEMINQEQLRAYQEEILPRAVEHFGPENLKRYGIEVN